MKAITGIAFCLLLQIGCDEKGNHGKHSSSKTDSAMQLSETELLGHVRKAIKPAFNNWVLFSNGTYIIFEEPEIKDLKAKAIEVMKEYGPIQAGGPAGDISVTTLTQTDGWVVGGHYFGMYTYVHPGELEQAGVENPADIDVGLFGRHKREEDGQELRVVHVNQE